MIKEWYCNNKRGFVNPRFVKRIRNYSRDYCVVKVNLPFDKVKDFVELNDDYYCRKSYNNRYTELIFVMDIFKYDYIFNFFFNVVEYVGFNHSFKIYRVHRRIPIKIAKITRNLDLDDDDE